ncbi:RNF8 [Symbiodinium necroappetens]|uniref:E3 ubiquitin-protein ligase CHFR n=1 Tax=Symbiodinium necroappetens TaxID=1628268 RepID=A0A813A1A1_9DINO|nr:RNF8 [Symbiodinium necroappetens]
MSDVYSVTHSADDILDANGQPTGPFTGVSLITSPRPTPCFLDIVAINGRFLTFKIDTAETCASYFSATPEVSRFFWLGDFNAQLLDELAANTGGVGRHALFGVELNSLPRRPNGDLVQLDHAVSQEAHQVLSHRSGRKLSLPRCKKGTMADPNNYRPISLLSTTYKRFARILQKRLKAVDEAYKKDGKFLPWLYSQNQPLRLGLRRRHRHLYRRSGAGTTDSAHAAGGGSARQSFPELEKSVLLRSTTASNHIQFLTGEGMKTATQAKYLGVMLWSDSPSKTEVITRLATYNAVFVPMLSYGMESAALTAAHLDRVAVNRPVLNKRDPRMKKLVKRYRLDKAAESKLCEVLAKWDEDKQHRYYKELWKVLADAVKPSATVMIVVKKIVAGTMGVATAKPIEEVRPRLALQRGAAPFHIEDLSATKWLDKKEDAGQRQQRGPQPAVFARDCSVLLLIVISHDSKPAMARAPVSSAEAQPAGFKAAKGAADGCAAARLVRKDLLEETCEARTSGGEQCASSVTLPWLQDASGHPKGRFTSPSVIYLFPGKEMKVGRQPDMCAVVMDCPEVPQMISRCHARLVDAEGIWVLTDEKSLNGIHVNDVKLNAPKLLRHGDSICFGRKLNDRPVFEYVFEEKDRQIPERPGKRKREPQADAVAVGQATATVKDGDVSTSAAWQEAKQCDAPGLGDLADAEGDNMLQQEMGKLMKDHMARVAQERLDLDTRRAELDAKFKQLEAKSQQPSKEASVPAVNLKELQSELVCSICRDWIVHAASIECGHMFCRECIDQWLAHKHFLCPVCRATVRQEPTAARTLDVIVDKTIQQSSASDMQEFQSRLKKADELQAKRRMATRDLEDSVKEAVRSKKKFFHVNQNWGKKEKKTFHDGVKQYISEGREAYCQLVGLTISWVYSADDSKLNQALHNLGLQEFVSKPEKDIRQRLLMFLRYGKNPRNIPAGSFKPQRGMGVNGRIAARAMHEGAQRIRQEIFCLVNVRLAVNKSVAFALLLQELQANLIQQMRSQMGGDN